MLILIGAEVQRTFVRYRKVLIDIGTPTRMPEIVDMLINP